MNGSLSARRAWIEISALVAEPPALLVALRKESVDRNTLSIIILGLRQVALRKESVDRNKVSGPDPPAGKVALRKESVDRNQQFGVGGVEFQVALRKESVDRNFDAEVEPVLRQRRSPQGERG